MIRSGKISVVISGAVARSGSADLDAGATVATALRRAGGLAYRGDARPAGELLLRRRLPSSRHISVFRWDIFEDASEAWREFPLERNDVLVFAWSVRDDAR